MNNTTLWTKNFISIIAANGLLFASFHSLLPTLPLYALSLGANGTEIGLISGIFGVSAIFIRLFTDVFVSKLGKKRCLYAGILLSLVATVSYGLFTSIESLLIARIIHGLGFGLGTTFAAALAVDIIPSSRRGEGVGYFGLGNTVSMGIAPALGVALLTGFNATFLFAFATIAGLLAMAGTKSCKIALPEGPVPRPPQNCSSTSLRDRFFERGTAFPSFLTMLFGIAYGCVNTFIAMLANEAGIGGAGFFFVTGTVFIFLSRTFGGRLYDAKGPFWVMLPGILCYTVALIIILLAHSLPILLTASVFYGLGAGLIMPSLMTWLFNSVPAERRSNASATYYNMLDVGTSGGIILLGSVAGSIGYSAMFYYILATMLLFLAVFLGRHFYRPITGHVKASTQEQ